MDKNLTPLGQDGESSAAGHTGLIPPVGGTHDEEEMQIEADEPDIADETLGDDSQSGTTSLKSAVTKYVVENGRRYHALKDGSYFLPNDESSIDSNEDELDRLDMFHHLLTVRCNDELHLAPINPHPQRILDLGTGTGIWAVEMGDLYPSAEVIGNDLSPVQPSLVPPNVNFEVDDIEADWLFTAPFDYIHCRYLAGAIRDWPRLVEQAYTHLAPGGWVEFQDFTMKFYTTHPDSTFRPGCSLDQWTDSVIEGVKTLGMEPEPGPQLEGWVKAQGFVNVVHKILPIPVGMWPKDPRLKEVGAFDLAQFLDGLEAISLRIFTNVLGWSADEVRVFLASVRLELKDPKLQAQHNFHVVYGQKPYQTSTNV